VFPPRASFTERKRGCERYASRTGAIDERRRGGRSRSANPGTAQGSLRSCASPLAARSCGVCRRRRALGIKPRRGQKALRLRHLLRLSGSLRRLAAENSSQKVNLFEDFTGRLDIGGLLGSAETAMYLYDVKPGNSFPYHYEYVEEWLLVLDGAVAIRTSEGERELGRGDLVRYPPGPEGAHQITNRSDTTARVLLFSKAAVPAVAVYPDTDTIGVWPDDDTEYYFKRDSAVSRDDD